MTEPSLLQSDEASPVDEVAGAGGSPFVLLCDHAGKEIPRALGSLGISENELATHIGWDIGAAALARRLASALGALTRVTAELRI